MKRDVSPFPRSDGVAGGTGGLHGLWLCMKPDRADWEFSRLAWEINKP